MPGIVEIKGKDGSTVFKCQMFDGLRLSLKTKNIQERFEMLKTLEYKKGDVVIVTFPKTGQLIYVVTSNRSW